MEIVINLAYYREKDWERFLASIHDRETMHESWNDWHRDFLKAKRNFISLGYQVNQCNVDIVELENYCRIRGIKNNGKARSEFVSGKR